MLKQGFDAHAVDNNLQRRDRHEFSFGQSAADECVVTINTQQFDRAKPQPVLLIYDQDLVRIPNRGSRYDDDVLGRTALDFGMNEQSDGWRQRVGIVSRDTLCTNSRNRLDHSAARVNLRLRANQLARPAVILTGKVRRQRHGRCSRVIQLATLRQRQIEVGQLLVCDRQAHLDVVHGVEIRDGCAAADELADIGLFVSDQTLKRCRNFCPLEVALGLLERDPRILQVGLGDSRCAYTGLKVGAADQLTSVELFQPPQLEIAILMLASARLTLARALATVAR